MAQATVRALPVKGMTTLAVPRSLRTSALSVYHARVDDEPYHCRTRSKIQGTAADGGACPVGSFRVSYEGTSAKKVPGLVPTCSCCSRSKQFDDDRQGGDRTSLKPEVLFMAGSLMKVLSGNRVKQRTKRLRTSNWVLLINLYGI